LICHQFAIRSQFILMSPLIIIKIWGFRPTYSSFSPSSPFLLLLLLLLFFFSSLPLLFVCSLWERGLESGGFFFLLCLLWSPFLSRQSASGRPSHSATKKVLPFQLKLFRGNSFHDTLKRLVWQIILWFNFIWKRCRLARELQVQGLFYWGTWSHEQNITIFIALFYI
jgi:hypothetical protein